VTCHPATEIVSVHQAVAHGAARRRALDLVVFQVLRDLLVFLASLAFRHGYTSYSVIMMASFLSRRSAYKFVGVDARSIDAR
jgi:hypothetical protein